MKLQVTQQMHDAAVPRQAIVRPINLHTILKRVDSVPQFVAPTDFTLGYDPSVQPVEVMDRALLYCADLAAERAVYTVLGRDEIAAAFAEPFLYIAQLHRARRILTVPFERLDEMASMEALHPTFV